MDARPQDPVTLPETNSASSLTATGEYFAELALDVGQS